MRNAIGGPCYHCGRTASPCWRRGPPDKPVLCNACGARWLTKKTLLGYTPGQNRGVSQQATPAADADDCSYNLVVPAVLKRKREHAFRNTLATFHGPPLFLPPPVERSPTNVSNSSHSSLSSLTLKAPTDDSSAASTMDSTKPLPAPAPLLTTWQPLLHSSALPHAVPANSGSPVSSTGPRPQQQMHVSLLLGRAPLAALRSPLGPLLIPQQQEQQQQQQQHEASAVPALPHRRPRKQQRPQPCGAV